MRYWDPIENRGKIRYCDSTFLGQETHTDLLNHLKSITNDLPSSKVYQLSMDRHNVNLNFYKEFSRLYKEENCHSLIDIGTCSLHSVHNSFQTGVESTGWNVKKVLKGALLFIFFIIVLLAVKIMRVRLAQQLPLNVLFYKLR